MDFALTAEQQMIVDTVRGFVESELYPLEDQVEKQGFVPPEMGQEIAAKVKQLGFFACNMPEEVGGGGLNHQTFTLVERELGRASMALTVFFGRPSGILMGCNDDQRERYLLPATRGDKFDALAMTEPGAGSDLRGMSCTARPDGDDWILNGTKHFISHANIADFVIVFVATGEEETPKGVKKLITCFLVDRGTPGFTIRDGYSSCPSRLPKLHPRFRRLPPALSADPRRAAQGFRARQCLALRHAVDGGCELRRPGPARLRSGGPYAAERHQFGKPIGANQGVSFKLADMITEIDAADYLTLAAAWRLDQGLPANREIASPSSMPRKCSPASPTRRSRSMAAWA